MSNIAEELQANTPEQPPEETPPAAEPVEAEAGNAPEVEPETGEKQEQPEPVEPPSTQSADTVPLSAHIGLRKETDAKLAERDQRIAELEQQVQAPEKKPDFFEDPDAALQAASHETNQAVAQQLLQAGEADAIEEYGAETVQESVTWALEAAQSSPYLAEQLAKTPLLRQHRKVVDLYKAEQARAELADPEKLRAQIREEERQKLLEEAKAEEAKKEELAKSIPKSLVGDSSAGALTGSDWAGPTPLESAVGEGG